jgi:putative RNA 2'-phosphotransferase
MSADLIKKSKYLSLLLRHDPAKAGITLDGEGWASVQELVDKAGFTKDELDEIVKTDDKKRYSFSGDRTKLKANQGHSVIVDLALKELQPPDVLYHGTARRFVADILTKGLLKMQRHHVHLSTDTVTAEKVGKRRDSNPLILYIDAKQMHADGAKFYLSENSVWLTEFVDPKYIRAADSKAISAGPADKPKDKFIRATDVLAILSKHVANGKNPIVTVAAGVVDCNHQPQESTNFIIYKSSVENDDQDEESLVFAVKGRDGL